MGFLKTDSACVQGGGAGTRRTANDDSPRHRVGKIDALREFRTYDGEQNSSLTVEERVSESKLQVRGGGPGECPRSLPSILARSIRHPHWLWVPKTSKWTSESASERDTDDHHAPPSSSESARASLTSASEPASRRGKRTKARKRRRRSVQAGRC